MPKQIFFVSLFLSLFDLHIEAAASFWTNVTPASSPRGRFGGFMTYDTTMGCIILFGGQFIPFSGRYIDQTWSYNSLDNQWTALNPIAPPPARDGCCLSFDAPTECVILFGGLNGGGYLNDTWSYDSTTNMWTQKTPTPSPSPRNAAAMAFDPPSGKIILFGGYGNGEKGDTWAYDGAANVWTELEPLVSPSARDSSLMTFDPVSEQIIMFGGYNNGCLNDTWGYSSTNNTWTDLNPNPAELPQARYGYGIAYDPCDEQVIIFGGGILNNMYLNDTWGYSSSSNVWTNLNPTNPPGTREFPMMAYDPWGQKIVLFSGVNNNDNPQSLPDTQTLTIQTSPIITSPITASLIAGIPFSFTLTTTGCPPLPS